MPLVSGPHKKTKENQGERNRTGHACLDMEKVADRDHMFVNRDRKFTTIVGDSGGYQIGKGVIKFDGTEFDTNLKAALILPDGKLDTPTFLVFENYEKILKWNISLRFGISVCTLANMIKT